MTATTLPSLRHRESPRNTGLPTNVPGERVTTVPGAAGKGTASRVHVTEPVAGKQWKVPKHVALSHQSSLSHTNSDTMGKDSKVAAIASKRKFANFYSPLLREF